MDTEHSTNQFTLQGNEVVHIANMDTDATAAGGGGEETIELSGAQTIEPVVAVHQEVEPMESIQVHDDHGVPAQDEIVHLNQHHHDHQEHHDSSIVGMDANEASEISNAILGTDEQISILEDGEVVAPPPVEEEGEQETPQSLLSWHDFFSQLQRHKATFGTLDVDPQTNPTLYNWIIDQRAVYKVWKSHEDGTIAVDDSNENQQEATAISQERIVLLDALGFDWEGTKEPNFGRQAEVSVAAANSNISGPTTHDVESFHVHLSKLEQYKSEHGHPNVPETYKDDPKLGKWVSQQRALFRKEALAQDRINALNEIGFDFTPGDKKISFETRIEQLREYKEINGHVNVPRKYEENPSLGEWLHLQKKVMRKLMKDGSSSNEVRAENRHQILIDMGVDFTEVKEDTNATKTRKTSKSEMEDEDNNNRSEKWDEKFNELTAFKAANGHTNVPRRSKRNPVNDALGEWVHFQRRQHRNLLKGENSTLTIARKKALECLGFQWYRNVGGNGLTMHSTSETYSSMRMSVNEAVQAQILKAYDDGRTAPWEHRFTQLTEYVQRFGNADVPINYAENLSLGCWVYRQRIAHKLWKEGLLQQKEKDNTQEEKEEEIDKQIAGESEAAIVDNLESEPNQATNDSQEKTENSGSQIDNAKIDEGNAEETNVDDSKINGSIVTDPNERQGEVSIRNETEAVPDAEEVLPNKNEQETMSGAQDEQSNKNEMGTTADEDGEVETSEIVTQSDYVDPSEYNKPYIPEVDEMTQERYDKLVSVGFDFQIKKIPDDFITHDGQDPAILILSKTAEEEEKPMLEDDKDIIEIMILEEIEEDETQISEQAKETCEGEVNTDVVLDHSQEKPSVPISRDEATDEVEEMSSDQMQNTDVADIEDTTMEEDKSIPAQDPMNQILKVPALDENHFPNDTVNKGVAVSEHQLPIPIEQEVDAVDDRMIEVNEDSESNLAADNPIGGNEANLGPQTLNEGQAQVPNMEVTVLPESNIVTNDTSGLQHEDLQPPKMKRKYSTITVKVEWEERILELIQYKIRKGNCNVPVKWKPNTGLADWVWRQREQYRLYRQGEPSTLTTTRIAKLTELGFEFITYDRNGNPVYQHGSTKRRRSPSDTIEKPPRKRKKKASEEDSKSTPRPKTRFKDSKWLQSLARVVAYKEQHGTCNVPRKWKQDPTLGEWVHFQRRQYRLKQLGRRNHMTEDRIFKLNAIGFEWSRGHSNPFTMRTYTDQNVEYSEEQKEEGQPGDVEMQTTDQIMETTPIDAMGDVLEQHIDHSIEQHIPLDNEHMPVGDEIQNEQVNMEKISVGDDTDQSNTAMMSVDV